MKPNFALNFSNDSIGLLHRTARGWLEIGATPQDAPDLAEALNYLRRSALGLAPHGVATKLIIPDDQILYLELSAPGPTDTHRDAQIRAALEGRTPYDVGDLAFDWAGDGPTVQVAVIARETLGEVEAFATEYRFNPVSFVATPDPARFDGEPWFGPADFATTLLQPGETVERDSEAVIVVSREPAPRAPQPTVAAEAMPEVAPEFAPEIATLAEAPDSPPPAAPELSVLDVALPAEAEPEPEPALPEPAQAPAVHVPTIDTTPMPVSALFPEVEEAPDAVALPESPAVPEATVAEDPVTAQPQPEVAAAVVEPDFDEAPYAEVMDDEDEPLPPLAEPRRTPTAPLTAPAHAGSAAIARSYDPEVDGAEDASPAMTPALQAALAAAREQGRGSSPLAAPPRPPRAAAKAGKGTGPVTAPGISGPGSRAGKSLSRQARSGRVDAQAAAQTLVAPPPDAAQDGGFRLTRAGGRGKPRYMGLILTGLLLLALAVIAAWSSITLSRNDTGDAAVVAGPDSATPLPSASEPAPDMTEAPTIDDEALADGQDLPAAEQPAPAEVTAPESTPALTAPPATTGTTAPQPPVSALATTTPAPGATPADQDDIVLSPMDTPPAAAGTLTVAGSLAEADALPIAPLPPPPFGTQYEFDADGLIRPTPEGIVTPEGVRLVAGRPPLVPPPRPASIAASAAAEAPAPAEAAAATGTGPTVTPAGVRVAPYTDPATQGGRPRPRPAGLRSEAPAEGAAAIPPEQRMTSLVPRSRPAAISAAFAKAEEQRKLDEEARKVAEAASLSAAAAAQDLAAAAQAEAATAQVAAAGPVAGGVGISRLPPSKPRNFDRRVQAALAAALTPRAVPDPQPEAQPVVQQSSATTAEPGEDEEGAPAASAPKIATKASVSQQATFSNAINLGRTNLIGVYGSPSRRYALIRTSSGSFKKVRVGDRIDGGTIAAITDSEVRYQKGGRLVALTMPKG